MKFWATHIAMVVAFVCTSIVSLAQQSETDSLINLLETTPDDTNKVLLYYRINNKLRHQLPDSANHYAFKALNLSQKIEYKSGLAKANLCIAINEKNQGKLEVAEPFYKESMRMSKEIGDSSQWGLALNGLGIVYKRKGDFASSTKYYLEAAEIYERLGTTNSKYNLATVYNNLGNLAKNNEDYTSSLNYHRKSLSLRREFNIEVQIAASYQNMANTFSQMNQTDSALMYYNMATEILHDKPEANVTLGNLLVSYGEFYTNLGKIKEGREKVEESIRIFKSMNDANGLASAYTSMASNYAKEGNHNETFRYGQLAYDMSVQSQNLLTQQEICETLIDNYSQVGNYEKAFEFQSKLLSIRDSIFQKDKVQSLIEAETKFDVQNHKEKLAMEAQAREAQDKRHEAELQLRDEKDRLDEAEKAKNQLLLGGVSIIALAMIVLVFFIWRSNVQRKRSNQKLERHQKEILIKNKSLEEANIRIQQISDEISQKNKDITDSINYAQKIQTNALPPISKLKVMFKEAFVIYKPKDIISGDFYWFDQLGDYAIIAVADCTGHGVPGALMSMTGLNLLNQIIGDKNIASPSHALKLLDDGIYKALSVTEKTETKDGMDISLIAINTKTKQMDYSGAARPLLIVKPDGNFEIIKGNKYSIGGHLQHNKTFVDTSVQLEEGDLIYAYSDGYADQFGGDKNPVGTATGKGKKFKNKALRELLISSRNHPLSEQQTIISDRFESWKGDYEQVDDVCMLGIKI